MHCSECGSLGRQNHFYLIDCLPHCFRQLVKKKKKNDIRMQFHEYKSCNEYKM